MGDQAQRKGGREEGVHVYLLIRNAPQSEFTIQRSTQEVAIIFRMEGYGRDKVNVLEAAETLRTGNVPQPYRLIHRCRQQEIVLKQSILV